MKTTLDRSFVRRCGAGVLALALALTATAALVAARSTHAVHEALSLEQTVAIKPAGGQRCRQYGQESLLDALILGAELYASSTRVPSADAIQRAAYKTDTRSPTCSTGRAR